MTAYDCHHLPLLLPFLPHEFLSNSSCLQVQPGPRPLSTMAWHLETATTSRRASCVCRCLEAHHNKAGVVIKNTFLEVRSAVRRHLMTSHGELGVPLRPLEFTAGICSDPRLRWEITSHRCMTGAEPDVADLLPPTREADKIGVGS